MRRLFLVVLLFSFISCQSQPDEFESFLENPQIHQWDTVFGTYAVICRDNVFLKEKPSIKSKSTARFHVLDQVTMIKREKKRVHVNGQSGHWAYVKLLWEKPIYGWVFDFDIGYKTSFRKVSSWKYRTLIYQLNSRTQSFLFQRDGSYITKEQRPSKGHLYQYKNVYWLNDPNAVFPQFFYIESDQIYTSNKFSHKYKLSSAKY